MLVWKLGLGPNIVVASATTNFATEEKAVKNALKNVSHRGYQYQLNSASSSEDGLKS
jgi:hypothetical protein